MWGLFNTVGDRSQKGPLLFFLLFHAVEAYRSSIYIFYWKFLQMIVNFAQSIFVQMNNQSESYKYSTQFHAENYILANFHAILPAFKGDLIYFDRPLVK
jgi:hypothetical protein